MMLLKQMRYFAAVVDCGSFTEAAAQCYISQSAISQQIRSLEQELGVELIHRENRHFSLTPAGTFCYSGCKQLLKDADELVRQTRAKGNGHRVRLRIGYLRSYSGIELSQAVADFSSRYPEVSISIVNGTHEELYDLLRTKSADLIFSDQRRAFSDAYVNDELTRCGCYVELSAQDPLAHQSWVSITQLQHLPCILVSSKEQRATEQEYYQNTLEFGGSYLFAETLEEARLMVISNHGFLPVERVGTLPAESAYIRRLPLYRDEAQLERRYCAFWRKGQSSVYIEAFASSLKKLIQRAAEKQIQEV